MLVTVFTPTYNRAYRLESLFKSLQRQTLKKFEWLIVDDGSSDDTESLVDSWREDQSFHIRYYKQENGGKHRAINKGVNLANGELFFIVDSDDELSDDCIEHIINYYSKVDDDPKIGGVVGMKIYQNGKRVGGEAFFDVLKCSRFDFRYKYKHSGDLAEVYKTSVMKEFPFPEFEGEKFCPEACVWVAMAKKYDLLFFNKGVYICEYLEDGLTSHIDQIRIKSPLSSCLTYRIEYKSPVPLFVKIKDAINFWRFKFHSHDLSLSNSIACWAFLLGWIMYRKDCKKYPNLCKR